MVVIDSLMDAPDIVICSRPPHNFQIAVVATLREQVGE
jgi:hypothetical protein